MAGHMRAAFAILAAALALSACATVSPEARVRAKLIAAGVKPRIAGCMADRMVSKLSLAQLKRLQALAGLKDRPVGEMSLDELLHRLRALDDPQIVSVVLRAGIGCSIAG